VLVPLNREKPNALELAHDAVAANTEHAGIVPVQSSFRGDEFRAMADAIFEAVTPYRTGLRGLVLHPPSI
jgi:hypothetical protein